MAGLVNQNIVDMAMFVDGTDSNGGSLFVETARLSETFFQQLRQHAVPLDEAAIRHIHNSFDGTRRILLACLSAAFADR